MVFASQLLQQNSADGSDKLPPEIDLDSDGGRNAVGGRDGGGMIGGAGDDPGAVSSAVSCLRSASVDAILRAAPNVPLVWGRAWGPVYDGVELAESLLKLMQQGRHGSLQFSVMTVSRFPNSNRSA